jgi:hypothetical protein
MLLAGEFGQEFWLARRCDVQKFPLGAKAVGLQADY